MGVPNPRAKKNQFHIIEEKKKVIPILRQGTRVAAPPPPPPQSRLLLPSSVPLWLLRSERSGTRGSGFSAIQGGGRSHASQHQGERGTTGAHGTDGTHFQVARTDLSRTRRIRRTRTTAAPRRASDRRSRREAMVPNRERARDKP